MKINCLNMTNIWKSLIRTILFFWFSSRKKTEKKEEKYVKCMKESVSSQFCSKYLSLIIIQETLIQQISSNVR